MPAIPYKKTGTTTDAWDGPAAMKNVTPDKAHLRALCAWVDPDGDAEKKSAYKLPHHDVSSDGTVGAANLKACSAVIAVLNGGRGGADIPEGDREAVYAHVSHHLKDGGQKDIPELRSAEDSVTERVAMDAAARLLRDAGEVVGEAPAQVDAGEANVDSVDDTSSPDGEAGDGSGGSEELGDENADGQPGEAADASSQPTEAETETETPSDSGENDEDESEERSSLEPHVRHGQMNEDRNVRRMHHAQVRSVQIDGQPGVSLKVIRYGVVDDFGSLWEPGCLIDGLNERLPQLACSHDRSVQTSIIGRAVPGFVDDGDGQIVNFRFADFSRVPSADIVHSLVQDQIVDECSVGFRYDYDYRTPTDEERDKYPGITEVITRAFVSEVSIVMEGAVPGAKVLAIRESSTRMIRSTTDNERGMIDDETAARIVAQFAQGAITLIDALSAIQQASVPMDDGRDVEGPPGNYDDTDEAPGDGTEDDTSDTDDDDDADTVSVDVHVEVPVNQDIDAELDQELIATLAKVFG